MDNKDEDLIIFVGVGALAWFGLIKPIMNTFGLTDDQAATLNQVQNTAPTDNPFSPQYKPFADLYEGVDLTQFFSDLKAQYDAGYAGSAPVNIGNPERSYILEIAKGAELINDAWPHFSLHGDRIGVEQVMASVTNKVDVAYLAAYLYYNYEKDLYKTLKEGGFMYVYGLPGEDLANIVTRINSLPE